MSLADALFSKVQQRVLALIFGHPERSFYTSQIIRRVRSGAGAVQRELARLELSGLVSVERIGNQKHYRANRDSPIFEELQSLVVKTINVAPRGVRTAEKNLRTPNVPSFGELLTSAPIEPKDLLERDQTPMRKTDV